MSGAGPFVAWPGVRLLGYAAALGAAQMAWFWLVYGGADWVTAHRTLRVPVHWEFEQRTPFAPAAVVVYMSIYPLFAAAPFVLRSARELNALSLTLAGVILAAGVSFLLIPAELAYTSGRDWGAWSGWYAVADRLNLQYNLVPSLHVALSMVCVDAYARRVSGTGKVLLWLWGAAIAASTLLTHEHHLLDAATGFLLAMAGTQLVLRRLTHEDASP